MKSYIALIRKEDGTDYWVDSPDIPGCVASGETLENAIASFEEVLAIHLQAVREAGLFLAEPRTLQDVLHAEEDPYIESYAIEIEDALPTIRLRFSRLGGV